MDERGAVPPAGYDPRSMDHHSAEYINLKLQALEERDTPVHPLPNAKTVSMTPQDDVMDERGAVPPAGYDPRSMDHNSAEYVNFKMQAVKVEGPPQIGAETVVKTQDGKTFIFEEDDMDERGAVPPAGYDPRSMDHNSAEYINLKMQALEERDTPVHPLPNAK